MVSGRLAALVVAEMEVQLDRGLGLRPGQAAFNALHAVAPEVARELQRGFPECDPFYVDDRLDAFYTWLSAHAYR
jgi:hypothetical protein